MIALPATRFNQDRQVNWMAIATLAVLFLMLFFPDFAFAQTASPFAGGAAQAKTDIVNIVAPIAGIAVIGVGMMAWFGKINWWWFVGLIVGLVLVFGHDQVVTWIRGWFSV